MLGLSRKRAKVYVEVRHGNAVMTRMVDLTYGLTGEPYAVISWINRRGEAAPADYVELDERRLRKTVLPGTFRYDGTIEDPRFSGRA